MGLRDSCGPGHPEGLQKGEIRNMNSLVGKSTGIALLMAAALLAALFAMGVFSATGVSAHDPDDATGLHGDATVAATIAPHAELIEYTGAADPEFADTGIQIWHDLAPPVDGTSGLVNAYPDFDSPNRVDLTYDEDTHAYKLNLEDSWEFLVILSLGAAGTTTSIGYSGESTDVSGYTYDSAFTPRDTADLMRVDLNDPLSDFGRKLTISVTDTADVLRTGTYYVNFRYDNPASSDSPGAAVGLTLKARAAATIPPGSDITVNLKDFGVPSTIAEERVLIQTLNNTGDVISGTPDVPDGGVMDSFRPEAIEVSGMEVKLTLPAGAADSENPAKSIAASVETNADPNYQIVFKQSAGITNPVTRGLKTVEIEDEDTANDEQIVMVRSKVSLDTSSGKRGTAVTLTATGIKDGGATAFLLVGCIDKDPACTATPATADIPLGNANASGNTVSIAISTTSSDFNHGVSQRDSLGNVLIEADTPYPKDSFLAGANLIYVVDGTGAKTDGAARFTITPTISVDADSVQQGDEIEITYEDWYFGGHAVKVTIGGEEVPETTDIAANATATPAVAAASVDLGLNADGEGEFTVTVPTTVRLGIQEIKVTGSTDTREGSLDDLKADSVTGSVTVGALDIDVNPSTIVLGQQFTINVSGFSDNLDGDDQITEVKVGDVPLEQSTAGTTISNLTIDTNGDFSDTFAIKSTQKVGTGTTAKEASEHLTPETYRVRVVDATGRVAVGTITIAEPSITIDPTVSRRGTTVTVVGEGFPATRVVNLYYGGTDDEDLLGAVLADSSGEVRFTFTVPSTAQIGEEQDVIARSAAIPQNKFRAKSVHSLPPQEVIVTPTTVASGGRVNIEGHNMPLFTLVGLQIGGIGVAGKGVETDGLGSFVINNVLVPQLKAGTHALEAEVATQGTDKKEVVRAQIVISSEITRDSSEAFENLIDNGTLTRVWNLDRQTQTWSFFDPAPEFADFNTLNEVSSGQIVTIIMNAQDTFQGQTLFTDS